MAKFYLSAAQFIREQPFEVLAPAFYHPGANTDTIPLTKPTRQRLNRHTFVATNFLNPMPFRQDVDPDQLQNCAYPIQTMLDMFQKKIEFIIVHDHDLPTIFDGLDRYLLSLRSDVELGIELSTAWARLVISWRAEVYKHYYRFMKLNPTAMEELYPNNDSVNNIFTLLAAISGVNKDQYKHDPLRARASPPYEVDKILPVPATEKTTDEFDMGSSIGLNQHSGDSLGGKDFDIEGFLKGG